MTLLLAITDGASVAGPEFAPPIWRTLFALVIVLSLLGGLGWLMRRGVLSRRGANALGIETALALGERRSLVIVSVEGRRLLLGLTPSTVALVTELKAPPATFDQAIARATGQGLGA